MSQPSLIMRNLRRHGQRLLGPEKRLLLSSMSSSLQGGRSWLPPRLQKDQTMKTNLRGSHGSYNQDIFGRSQLRSFHSEGQYHKVADETLEEIQDAVEEALEDANVAEFEVSLASGVLTMVMPPHGTWVLNKQTPNQQLWWSSPLSGPRRYGFEDGDWVYTRDEAHSTTLTLTLKEELLQIYQVELDL
jgi:frataxin